MFIGLPSRWVYVIYENGKEDNVACQDTLSKADAEWFKKEWEKEGGKINRIELRNNNDIVLQKYIFD